MFKRIVKEALCSLITIVVLVSCYYMILEGYRAGTTYRSYTVVPRLVWNDQQQFKLTNLSAPNRMINRLAEWRYASEQGLPWFIKVIYSKTIKQQEQQNLFYLCSLQNDYKSKAQQDDFNKGLSRDLAKTDYKSDTFAVLFTSLQESSQEDWQKLNKIDCSGVVVND